MKKLCLVVGIMIIMSTGCAARGPLFFGSYQCNVDKQYKGVFKERYSDVGNRY